MVENIRTVQTEMLIVGAGGAGARAAIEADKQHVDIVLIDKGLIGKAGCTPTTGSRALPRSQREATGDRFSNDIHVIDAIFKRILQTGCYLNDQDLRWLWVSEQPELRREITGWTSRAQDSYSDALNKEIAKHPKINVMEYVMVTRLLTHRGQIAGATALDLVSGDFLLLKAKVVILACGGYGELYSPSECTPADVRTGVTGDGS